MNSLTTIDSIYNLSRNGYEQLVIKDINKLVRNGKNQELSDLLLKKSLIKAKIFMFNNFTGELVIALCKSGKLIKTEIITVYTDDE